MVWRKYKHAYLAFGTAAVFSLTIWFFGNNGFFAENKNFSEPEINVISQLIEDQFFINAGTYIYEEKKYLLCDDVETKLVIDHNKYIGQTVSKLQQTEYSAIDGWQVDIINNDTVVFFQEINGFCQEHAGKRHLAVKDGNVVVMYGPRGTNGGIAQFTNIPIKLLPENLQMQIEAGLLEFNSHDDALQSLDSLDEHLTTTQ